MLTRTTSRNYILTQTTWHSIIWRAADYKEAAIHISKHFGLYLTSNINSSCLDIFTIFKSILDRPYNYTPVFIKISIDKAIQSYENNSINNAISHLQAAYHQLLMSANSTKTTISNIQTLLLLIEHTIGLISENNTNAEAKYDSIMYLNALEEQLGPSVSTSYTRSVMTGTANSTSSKKLFLEYENEPYGLKIQYPYDWIIRINYNYSLPTTSSYIHPQIIGSFYLPNPTEGLPFLYTGVNTNLSKEFKQFPFTLEQYLHKSLQAKKNSSAFLILT